MSRTLDREICEKSGWVLGTILKSQKKGLIVKITSFGEERVLVRKLCTSKLWGVESTVNLKCMGPWEVVLEDPSILAEPFYFICTEVSCAKWFGTHHWKRPLKCPWCGSEVRLYEKEEVPLLARKALGEKVGIKKS